MNGVLFIGHGTRRQHGIVEFLQFVRGVEALLGKNVSVPMAHAFLELEPPDIVEGIRSLFQQGVTHITAVPLFLFSAGHIHVDIPTELTRAQALMPDVTVELMSPLGTEHVLVETMIERTKEALRTVSYASDTASKSLRVGVLLLGRGNKDETAQQTFEAIAPVFSESLAGIEVQTGYLAGTGVPMEVRLTEMVKRGTRHIVISPYLLFSGWLTDTLTSRVEAWLVNYPGVAFSIGQHVGPDDRVVEWVAHRVLSRLREQRLP